MISIAPTITTDDPAVYKQQMLLFARFARRVHIDIADGKFAPTKLTPIKEVWWPGSMQADVHVMYERPYDHARLFLAMRPDMIIVHAEAAIVENFELFARLMHKAGIRVGVALLPKTRPQEIIELLEHIDHVLIFGGKLGFQGGKADLKNLKKVPILRAHKPALEISWDGGVTSKIAPKLIAGGIDVLNVGSFISKAVNPYAAYATLETIAQTMERRLEAKKQKKLKKSNKQKEPKKVKAPKLPKEPKTPKVPKKPKKVKAPKAPKAPKEHKGLKILKRRHRSERKDKKKDKKAATARQLKSLNLRQTKFARTLLRCSRQLVVGIPRGRWG